jgi:hypothetical protein
MACPSVERWIALASGEAEGSQALFRHAEACPSCLSELSAALAALAAPPEERLLPSLRLAILPARRRAWKFPLAAAALLLVVFAFSFREGGFPARTMARALRSPDPVLPAATDRVLALGRTGTLALRDGVRFSVSPGRVVLEQGALALTARGEGVELAWEDYRIRVERGELVLESQGPPPPASSVFLREAHAASGRAVLSVLRGRASVLRGGERLDLEAGSLAVLDGGRLEARPFGAPPSWIGGWRRVPGAEGILTDAARDLAPRDLPACYAWEVLLRRHAPAVVVEVRFPIGERGWSLPLGANIVGEAGSSLRIGLERRGDRLRLEVCGKEVFDGPVSALEGRLQPASVSAPGLKAWGGGVEVEEARWLPLLP